MRHFRVGNAIALSSMVSVILLTMAIGGCGAADSGFAVGTVLPNESIVLQNTYDPRGRDLMAAVFHGDRETVRRMLQSDPNLALTADGSAASEMRNGLLEIAIAREDKGMVNLLLAEHVSPNYPPQFVPLGLALAANDPWYAYRLLHAGANPNPLSASAPFPLSDAASVGDIRSMSILIRSGADLTGEKTFGRSALLRAVDQQEFRSAEYLIDNGYNIWMIDPMSGRSLSPVCSTDNNINVFTRNRSVVDAGYDLLTKENVAEEIAARQRVRVKLEARGFPCPAPSKGDLASLVLTNQWPPATARRMGAPNISAALIAEMSRYWNPDGTRKPWPPRADSSNSPPR